MATSQAGAIISPHLNTHADEKNLAPWDVLGRDTAAGRALYNVYCGDTRRKTYGAQATLRNKVPISAQPCSVPAPPSISPSIVSSKAHVKTPRVGGPRDPAPDEIDRKFTQVFVRPERRPGAEILESLRRDDDEMQAQLAPAPRGPLLDEHEKERCAQMMEHRGELPQLNEDQRMQLHQAQQFHPPLTRSQQLQQTFSDVNTEIQERQVFIKDMRSFNRPKREYEHVLLEIASRLKELETLDLAIKNCADTQ